MTVLLGGRDAVVVSHLRWRAKRKDQAWMMTARKVKESVEAWVIPPQAEREHVGVEDGVTEVQQTAQQEVLILARLLVQ